MAKILIVEDDAANRDLLTEILMNENEGHIVLEADSGKMAFEIMEKEEPDIILLDVKMPDMDGFDICRKLKADDKTKSIPVIFITTLAETKDKIKGFQIGGADYIIKPITNAEVIARIMAHLRIKKAEEERIEAENLKTLKQMVVTYNHNMNQPLTLAYMEINMLLRNTKSQEELCGSLGSIKKALDSINHILKKIRELDKIKVVDYVNGVQMIEM